MVNTILTFVMKDSLIESWVDANPGWKKFYDEGGVEAVQGNAPAFGAIAIVGLLVFGLIWIGLAFVLQRGANWARIVLSVLAVLSIASSLLSFVRGGMPALFLVIAALTVVATVALLVFLWRPDSSAFLKRS